MPTGIDDDLETRVTHGYADHDGVRLHYASLGAGPLVARFDRRYRRYEASSSESGD